MSESQTLSPCPKELTAWFERNEPLPAALQPLHLTRGAQRIEDPGDVRTIDASYVAIVFDHTGARNGHSPAAEQASLPFVEA